MVVNSQMAVGFAREMILVRIARVSARIELIRMEDDRQDEVRRKVRDIRGFGMDRCKGLHHVHRTVYESDSRLPGSTTAADKRNQQ